MGGSRTGSAAMIGVAAAVATMLVLGVLFVVALDALAQRWALRRVQPG